MKLDEMTPRQIVAELDRYIVGQHAAKRAVAIALRNRVRRSRLDDEMKRDVTPKNILMIGPTGVGKTEIARRLAHLAGAPFAKVEATKFTEVGYVGRDVDSMVRDLVEAGVAMVEKEKLASVQERAGERVHDRLLDLLVEKPQPPQRAQNPFGGMWGNSGNIDEGSSSYRAQVEQTERLRGRMKEKLERGELEEAEVEVEIEEKRAPGPMFMGPGSGEEMGFDMQSMLGGLLPGPRKTRRMKVKEARSVIHEQEAQKLVDRDAVIQEAIDRVQENGILFIDEMDKVAGREGAGGSGPQVSREGVQRDILPLVEGSTVSTKHGPVRTDHVLFIAAGAFHVSKPSDLIPELQGRFPIRVELTPLTEDDFRRILTEPRHALLKQYAALLEVDGVQVEWAEDAIAEIASFARQVNEATEDIGARRLHTMVEKLLEDLAFDAPDQAAGAVRIDREFVRSKLAALVHNEDLSRYIL
jgi:ATP-dependent HslUV protease ATP-binding subunit HslU